MFVYTPKPPMRLFTSIFMLINLLISCSKKNDMASPGPPALDSAKTYLALGDSYTVGESVPASKSFPQQTVDLLGQRGVTVSKPDIVAITGWTTGDLLRAVNNTSLDKEYAIVTLLIGVNNQYRGLSIDEYKTEFTALLTKAIAFAGNNANHVFVLSIPDYGVTPFASGRDTARIAKQIDEFNAANKFIADSARVNYLDITPISRGADPALVAGDGLHPSALQYSKWAALLAPLVAEKIK